MVDIKDIETNDDRNEMSLFGKRRTARKVGETEIMVSMLTATATEQREER
jgi:hypothetical protein